MKLVDYEKTATTITNSYNLAKLYAVQPQVVSSNILGFIEIPKINIYYSVFSIFTEENLKVSPCKFAGPNINEQGNLCIVGHNYENNTFFSNLNLLEINDNICLYDTLR